MEFTGLRQNTTPVSIGIIADNGAKFYSEFTDYDRTQINPWLRDNVLANLKYPTVNWDEFFTGDDLTKPDRPYRRSNKKGKNSTMDTRPSYYNINSAGRTPQVNVDLCEWLIQFGGQPITVWGDVPAWDWILFCELLGGTFKMQEDFNIFYIPKDISMLLVDSDVNREELIGKKAALKLLPDYRSMMGEGTITKHNAFWDALVIKEIVHHYNSRHPELDKGKFIN